VGASDRGYATAQVEAFARSGGALRERYADLKAIANALDLEWDAEFRVVGAAPTPRAALAVVRTAWHRGGVVSIREGGRGGSVMAVRGVVGARLCS
jgi:hypothetical protein